MEPLPTVPRTVGEPMALASGRRSVQAATLASDCIDDLGGMP